MRNAVGHAEKEKLVVFISVPVCNGPPVGCVIGKRELPLADTDYLSVRLL